jgi:hypothetical protein
LPATANRRTAIPESISGDFNGLRRHFRAASVSLNAKFATFRRP